MRMKLAIMLIIVLEMTGTVAALPVLFVSPLPTRPPIQECSTDACLCERFGHCQARELEGVYRALEAGQIAATEIKPAVRQTSEIFRVRRDGRRRGR